jgi:hypothetical protein
MAKNSISGLSVAGAFVALGVTYAYFTKDVFGEYTPYIAAALILLGFTAAMMELQKLLKDFTFRFDNGGVGLLLGVPGIWLTYLAYVNTTGFWRIVFVVGTSAMLLIAFAGMIDFFISVFESLTRREKGKAVNYTGLLKFLTLLASTVGVIYSTLRLLIG